MPGIGQKLRSRDGSTGAGAVLDPLAVGERGERSCDDPSEYILTHVNRVAWAELLRSMVSSQPGADIDHCTVYREQTA